TDEAGYEPDRQPAELGGRALTLHQLDFALGQGCGKILFLGHGGGPEALALRHAAERAGAQFQVLRGPRDVPATVRGDDELLVLARGLLPDSPRASEMLRQGPVIVSLPVQAGAAGGFGVVDPPAAWGRGLGRGAGHARPANRATGCLARGWRADRRVAADRPASFHPRAAAARNRTVRRSLDAAARCAAVGRGRAGMAAAPPAPGLALVSD